MSPTEIPFTVLKKDVMDIWHSMASEALTDTHSASLCVTSPPHLWATLKAARGQCKHPGGGGRRQREMFWKKFVLTRGLCTLIVYTTNDILTEE